MSGVSTTLLDTIYKILRIKGYYDKVSNTVDPTSLSSVAKATTVEPFCVISKDCANLEYMYDVNNTLLNMFTAYYLQAVSTMLHIDNVVIRKLLNATGTNLHFIQESHSLDEDILRFKLPNTTNLSLENSNTSVKEVHLKDGKEYPDLQAYSNLAIGKLIEIKVNMNAGYVHMTKERTMDEIEYENDGSIKPSKSSKTKEQEIAEDPGVVKSIPVIVRLLVNVVSTKAIESLLVRYKEDIGFTERWYSWRAGRISFWKDLVFCQDLIKEHKKNVITSDNNLVKNIDERVNNAIKTKLANISIKTLDKGINSVTPADTYSFGVASNLYVITASEATKIEYFLHGKLSDARTRNKLFGNGFAMILAVIDPDRERVKFYINSVDGYTDLSVKEIKSMSKNKGPDINDMLKMLQMGMSPTF